MTRVAVLRPEPGNARTADRIASLGYDVLRMPLFAVTPVDWQVPEGAFDTLMLTSANAVRHGGAGLNALKRLPVLAVGAATAAAARQAGFDVVATGSGDAASLLADHPGRRILHPAGRDRIENGRVEAVTVYAADPIPIAPDTVATLAGAIALLHSARAARRFAALADAGIDRGAVRVVALSPVILAAAGTGWAAAAAAAVPREDALLAALANLAD